MELIDHENDVLCLDGLVYDALDTALELASELGSGNHGRKVELPDLHVEELLGNAAFNDLYRKTLCNRSLTYTGGTNENRVVLGPSVKDLNASFDLFVASYDPVYLAFSSTLGKVRSEFVKELHP